MTTAKSIPSVSVTYARTGRTARSNELGMRPIQERAWEKRGEQYLLIKSPPASGKSRALMFHRARQAREPGSPPSGHRRSREDDRRELLGRAAQPVRLLDGLDRPASVFRRCRPVSPTHAVHPVGAEVDSGACSLTYDSGCPATCPPVPSESRACDTRVARARCRSLEASRGSRKCLCAAYQEGTEWLDEPTSTMSSIRRARGWRRLHPHRHNRRASYRPRHRPTSPAESRGGEKGRGEQGL